MRFKGAIFLCLFTLIIFPMFLNAQDTATITAGNCHAVPNPVTSNQAVIQYQLLGQAQGVTVELLTMKGESISFQAYAPVAIGINRVTFDVSSLANGVYLYRIKAKNLSGTESVVIKKVVITR